MGLRGPLREIAIASFVGNGTLAGMNLCERLRERAAEVLGMTVEETRPIHFRMLRDMVVAAGKQKLAAEMTAEIVSGRYIIGERRAVR